MFLHPADTSDTIIFGQEKRCNYTTTGDNFQLITIYTWTHSSIGLLCIRVLLRNLLFREKMRRTDDPSDLFI